MYLNKAKLVRILTIACGLVVLLVATLWAVSASAQSVRDCVTTTCTVRVDDVAAPAVVPTICRLYNSGAVLTEVPAVAPYACTITRNYAAGLYSLTMRYATATAEGPDSNVLAFESRPPATLGTPTNFRFQ